MNANQQGRTMATQFDLASEIASETADYLRDQAEHQRKIDIQLALLRDDARRENAWAARFPNSYGKIPFHHLLLRELTKAEKL